MRALSIKQPWAWLIVNGFKDIENRKTLKNFRGKFLIHSGQKKPSPAEWIEWQRFIYKKHRVVLPPMEEHFGVYFGGIVGSAYIIGSGINASSEWYEKGHYGLALSGAKPLPFYPLKGQLSFFEVDYPHQTY